MNSWRLLADVGGTNIRFGRADSNTNITQKRSYLLKDFTDFEAALSSYAAETGGLEGCAAAAVGAAGPVFDGAATLTNAPWQISESRVSGLIGGGPVCLINDLEAVALALPRLEEADIRPISAPAGRPAGRHRMLALNVGTGFGAAVALPVEGRWLSCPSEAGHMSFGVQSASDLPLLGGEGYCTLEDVLSGEGLVRLYERHHSLQGTEAPLIAAQEVFARVKEDSAAKETLHTFTRWLGEAARNLVLATGSWGGVFMTGGVVHGWAKVAPFGRFREAFEHGHKMQERLRPTFTGIVLLRDAALLGLSHASLAESSKKAKEAI